MLNNDKKEFKYEMMMLEKRRRRRSGRMQNLAKEKNLLWIPVLLL